MICLCVCSNSSFKSQHYFTISQASSSKTSYPTYPLQSRALMSPCWSSYWVRPLSHLSPPSQTHIVNLPSPGQLHGAMTGKLRQRKMMAGSVSVKRWVLGYLFLPSYGKQNVTVFDILKSSDPFPGQMWPGQSLHLKAILVLCLPGGRLRNMVGKEARVRGQGTGSSSLPYVILYNLLIFQNGDIYSLTLEYRMNHRIQVRAAVERTRAARRRGQAVVLVLMPVNSRGDLGAPCFISCSSSAKRGCLTNEPLSTVENF